MSWNYRICRKKVENTNPTATSPDHYWRYGVYEVYYREDTGGIAAISTVRASIVADAYDDWDGDTVTEDDVIGSIVFMAEKILEAVDKPVITLPLTYPCDRDGNPVA